jgi:putative hydrolase of the HAD superfamily
MASSVERFCMIGNSVRSDSAPVLDGGGAGVHVPYHLTWAVERADIDEASSRFARVKTICEAPAAVARLSA